MTALLFADFETTSLNTTFCTVLEGAWTVTSLDGIQRTPLRHRYMSLYKGNHSKVTPNNVASHSSGGQYFWHNYTHGDSVALKMAQDSHLFEDWLACAPVHRLEDGLELERLLLDDVSDGCLPGEDVHLCGAGAARFDYSILARHCPRVVPDFGERFKPRLSYRPVDTSGMQTGLIGEKNEKALYDFYVKHGHSHRFDIELDDFPRYSYGDTNTLEWVQSGVGGHRSAPDVARAMMSQRALWQLGAPLRRFLAGETV